MPIYSLNQNNSKNIVSACNLKKECIKKFNNFARPFAEDVLEEIGPEKWNEWFSENPLVDGIPQPFKWDEERRLNLRCELDVVYAHLYGISKDDLDYILGTFPIVKRKNEAKYGVYRTRDLILEYYEKYEGALKI
ncbi:hypothetical protein FXV91_17335 [Methanosarcina sp. DH2]|uniref:hypothetical protein n=1 Tax=Methanosarcina sp. DH2 TaxID=2605639 RepID=UPI001E5EEFDF|nr:hypothetical protein [Methanosarcina sp. DH2]MCC4771862.1 hypothetical protein [Methanosarcina sp. DH2]